jgi:hypothetical protein
MPKEGWELDSGLNTPIDLTVHAAYFSTNADYQSGQTYQLYLIGNDEHGNPQELRLSVGADWTSQDGGRTIKHPTRRKINQSSIYGHFIEAAFNCPEVVDGKHLSDVLMERGNGWEAESWQNLSMHLDPVKITFGPKLDPVERLLPTHYLGIATDDLPTNSQPATVTTTAPSPSAAATNGASPLFSEMVELARTSSTYIEFQRAAFARDDVLADEELAEQVADKEGGVWASR